MYRLFFKEPVIFHRRGGGVEDLWENIWLEGERRGDQLSPIK